MATNHVQFAIDCTKSEKQVIKEWSRWYRTLALTALRRIVLRTPVDTGRARGNWQVSLGGSVEGEKQVPDPVGEGRALIDGGVAADPFVNIWIQNNVGYINILEHGGFDPPNPGPSKDRRKGRKGKVLVSSGFSVQAPNGMVQVTLDELSAVVQP